MFFPSLERMGKQFHHGLIDPKHDAKHTAGKSRQDPPCPDKNALQTFHQRIKGFLYPRSFCNCIFFFQGKFTFLSFLHQSSPSFSSRSSDACSFFSTMALTTRWFSIPLTKICRVSVSNSNSLPSSGMEPYRPNT